MGAGVVITGVAVAVGATVTVTEGVAEAVPVASGVGTGQLPNSASFSNRSPRLSLTNPAARISKQGSFGLQSMAASAISALRSSHRRVRLSSASSGELTGQ